MVLNLYREQTTTRDIAQGLAKDDPKAYYVCVRGTWIDRGLRCTPVVPTMVGT